MQKNKIKINNKEYIIPESSEYFFREYLQKQKLNDLSKKHDKLLNEYKNLNILNFNKKRKVKLELYKISNEMMQIGIIDTKNIEIPDFESIKNVDQKFNFMYKFNDLLCNTITILSEDIHNLDYENIYRQFFSIINKNIYIAKKEYSKQNYELTFKKIYDSIEKCLILYKLILNLDKNQEIDIDSYIQKK